MFKNEKKVVNEQKQSDQKLIDKWNLSIDLVKESDEDVKIAALYKFNTLGKYLFICIPYRKRISFNCVQFLR